MTAYTFDQLITFTRTSAATYVGSNGLVAVTPASRNLLIYTQDFDNAAWVKTNTTITADSAAAPDGTMTADTLTAGAGAGSGQQIYQALTTIGAGSFVYSIYAKQGSGETDSNRFVVFNQTASLTFASITVNYSSGVVTQTVGTGATMTAVGNGWWRVVIPFTSTATLGNSIRFFVGSSGSVETPGEFIYAWGAQLEAASAASTYTRNNGGVYPPRFDYDPVTRAPRGLLIEEQRTNLVTYSEDITNAAWFMLGTAGASRTANATTAPDGTSNADRYTVGTGSGAWYIANYANQNITNGQAYTFSVYVKANGLNYVFVRPHNNTVNLGASGFIVSLIDGTITYPSTPIAPASTGTATNVGNGWWKIAATSTANGTVTPSTGGPGIWPCNSTAFSDAGGTAPANFTGDGTSGVYIWGAQLEAGPFATSYIPTVASQVTRTADLAAITAPMFAPWYRQSEGTFVYQYQRLPGLSVALGGRIFASGVGGSNSYGIWVNTATSTQDALTIRDISGDAVASALFTVNTSAVNKGGVAYKANDFAWSSNGGAATTDTSGAVPSLSDQLRLGRAINTDASYLNGHIQSIDYYPTRLTNAQIQALTA